LKPVEQSAVQVLNDLRPWWGLYEPHGRELGIGDLIENGTLTAESAAAVWWLLQRGGSLWVVAGPQGAGKTTLATALLSFLPDDARLYVTSGPRDRLDLPEDRHHLYLLVNELSWHLPFYFHGPPALRAFEMLADGLRIVGTLHARSAAEALAVMCGEAGVSESTIARARDPLVVVVLSAFRTPSGVARRVVEVAVMHGNGVGIDIQGVDEWAGLESQAVRDEIKRKADELEQAR
jgi:energy-coupling factor transporter ATP-binding protein EcfA2